MGDDAWGGLPNLNRLVDEISARPAAQAAVALKEVHAFKAEMDEEARRHMFRHLAAQAS
jgi:GST-like protein